MQKTALIMAGGRGERFWPRSRQNMPKQFLSLTDDGKTMIQLTVERILPLVAMEDIFIVTNRRRISSASRWGRTPRPASAWVRCIWRSGTGMR